MNLIRNLLFSFLSILLGVIFAALVVEVTMGQWIFQDEWAPTRKLNLIRDVNITYDVSEISGHTQKEVQYTRDAFGLRAKCKPEEIDIITIGGSTTDQRLISDGQTWQDILSEIIETKSNKKICIGNAGVDGHSTFGHIQSIQSWFALIKGLSPKLAVLYVGLNDVGRFEPQRGFDNLDHPNESPLLREIREKSAIYELADWVSARLSQLRPVLPYAGHAKNPPKASDYGAASPSSGIQALSEKNRQAFEGRLIQLMEALGAKGIRPVCVTQPHIMARKFEYKVRGLENAFYVAGHSYNGLDFEFLLQDMNKAMEQVCIRYGGYFLEIESSRFNVEDFYDPIHMNPPGARRLAEELAAQFAEKNIIQKEFSN